MAPSSPSAIKKRSPKPTKEMSAASSPLSFPASHISAPVARFDRQTLLLCLGLMVLVCAFYAPVIHNGFIGYDDGQYIVDNSYVKDGLTWPTVEWAFTSFEQANWHPLTWLSHALDCSLFGLNPAGHHAVNVLLHAINAALLFLLLQGATGFRWRSLMVAALFALHPVNVESVAWAAERKNVLSMMFFLLAFLAYDWYAREPRLRRYLVMASLYALALLAKPQVITFPFLLLLWDYWPLRRIGAGKGGNGDLRAANVETVSRARIVWEKVPLLALSAVSAVLTVLAQKAGGAVRDLEYYGLLLRVENALVAYVRYVGKAFWPAKLVVMYPHPARLFPVWQPVTAAALLLAISVWVVRETLVNKKEKKYLAVGWFWFLGSLVPVIGLVQVGEQAMADRYAYISFIGLFVMVVWSVGDWVSEYRARSDRANLDQANRWLSPRYVAVPACACVLLLGVLTTRQVRYWHDTESFWRRTVALEKDDVVGHQNLANILHERGQDDEALKHVSAVLAVRPKDAVANLLLGDYDRAGGDFNAAIERYQTVALSARATGPRSHAYDRLGATYRQMGQSLKARQAYESSLQVSPGQPEAMIQLGTILQNDGDLAGAARMYSRAVALHASDVGYILLARDLQLQGRDHEALAMVQRAAKLTKNLDESEKHAAAMLAGR
jgi:protein O-mannosyl-transferase